MTRGRERGQKPLLKEIKGDKKDQGTGNKEGHRSGREIGKKSIQKRVQKDITHLSSFHSYFILYSLPFWSV